MRHLLAAVIVVAVIGCAVVPVGPQASIAVQPIGIRPGSIGAIPGGTEGLFTPEAAVTYGGSNAIPEGASTRLDKAPR